MTDPSADPRRLLPLPSHDFQVLLSLADAPRHAYGMAKAVDGQSSGVRLEIGSLYRILARLTGRRIDRGFPAVERRRGARGATPLLPAHAVRSPGGAG